MAATGLDGIAQGHTGDKAAGGCSNILPGPGSGSFAPIRGLLCRPEELDEYLISMLRTSSGGTLTSQCKLVMRGDSTLATQTSDAPVTVSSVGRVDHALTKNALATLQATASAQQHSQDSSHRFVNALQHVVPNSVLHRSSVASLQETNTRLTSSADTLAARTSAAPVQSTIASPRPLLKRVQKIQNAKAVGTALQSTQNSQPSQKCQAAQPHLQSAGPAVDFGPQQAPAGCWGQLSPFLHQPTEGLVQVWLQAYQASLLQQQLQFQSRWLMACQGVGTLPLDTGQVQGQENQWAQLCTPPQLQAPTAPQHRPEPVSATPPINGWASSGQSTCQDVKSLCQHGSRTADGPGRGSATVCRKRAGAPNSELAPPATRGREAQERGPAQPVTAGLAVHPTSCPLPAAAQQVGMVWYHGCASAGRASEADSDSQVKLMATSSAPSVALRSNSQRAAQLTGHICPGDAVARSQLQSGPMPTGLMPSGPMASVPLSAGPMPGGPMPLGPMPGCLLQGVPGHKQVPHTPGMPVQGHAAQSLGGPNGVLPDMSRFCPQLPTYLFRDAAGPFGIWPGVMAQAQGAQAGPLWARPDVPLAIGQWPPSHPTNWMGNCPQGPMFPGSHHTTEFLGQGVSVAHPAPAALTASAAFVSNAQGPAMTNSTVAAPAAGMPPYPQATLGIPWNGLPSWPMPVGLNPQSTPHAGLPNPFGLPLGMGMYTSPALPNMVGGNAANAFSAMQMACGALAMGPTGLGHPYALGATVGGAPWALTQLLGMAQGRGVEEAGPTQQPVSEAASEESFQPGKAMPGWRSRPHAAGDADSSTCNGGGGPGMGPTCPPALRGGSLKRQQSTASELDEASSRRRYS